jgi:hypothetical protein
MKNMKYIITVTEKETGAVVDEPIECDGVCIVARNDDEGASEVVHRDMNLATLAAAIYADEHLEKAAGIALGFEKWKRSLRGKWVLWKARMAERRD